MFALVIWFVLGLVFTVFTSRGMAKAMGADAGKATKAGVVGYVKGFVKTVLSFYAALIAILSVLSVISKVAGAVKK